jgi:hypothetical protein
MASFKSLYDLSEKQKEFLEEIKIALDFVDVELSKKLEYFIDDLLEEAYESGTRDHY